MNKKLRQTHQWDVVETLLVRCPNCHKQLDEQLGYFIEGDVLHCRNCHKDFQLGERK